MAFLLDFLAFLAFIERRRIAIVEVCWCVVPLRGVSVSTERFRARVFSRDAAHERCDVVVVILEMVRFTWLEGLIVGSDSDCGPERLREFRKS